MHTRVIYLYMFDALRQVRGEQPDEDEPGCVPALFLTRRLTEILRVRALEGLKGLPRRDAEVGGLITSTRQARAIGTDVRLVSCEYASGPSYILSDSDVSRLSETARKCESEGRRVVAYFRSCTRPSMRVEREDEAAIAGACPQVQNIVIAKPSLDGSVGIYLFSRERNGNWSDAMELEAAIAPDPVATIPAKILPGVAVNGHRSAPDEQERGHEAEPAARRARAELNLTREALEIIRARSFDALKTLPGRGAEIGGLVTSAKSSPSIGANIRLATCEYSFGPSYVLSSSDIDGLRESARQCEAEGQTVVAYFRSCTRSSMKVEAEDELAIAQGCPSVSFVVVAKPSLNGGARVCLFHRDTDGSWHRGTEFDVAPPRAAAVPPVVEPVANPPVPEASRRWGAYAVAFLLVVFSAAALWIAVRPYRPDSTAAQPAPIAAAPSAADRGDRTLGLSAREENGRLHVVWNRDSAAVHSAVSGVLEIVDSSGPVTITLPKPDIDGGSIIYKPESGDVTFRLQLVDAEGKSLGEMVRVLGNGPLPDTTASARPRRAAGDVAAVAPTAPSFPVRNVAAQGFQIPAVARFPALPADTSLSAPVQASAVTKDSGAIVASSHLAAPLPTQPRAPAPVTEPSAATVKPVSTAQVPAAPPVTRIATPPPQVTAPVPPPAAPTQVIVPPLPLHKVSPVFDNSGRVPWLTYKQQTVIVVVTVDEKGKVLDARADNKIGLLSQPLVNAARQWTFKPATRGGIPVPSEYTIQFVFRPGS